MDLRTVTPQTSYNQKHAGSKPAREPVQTKKTNAYNFKARPPNTNHKQVCSGKDTPPQPELAVCLREKQSQKVVCREVQLENRHWKQDVN